MASICGIAIKPVKKGPMQCIHDTAVGVDSGLQGDIRGNGGREGTRQVTLVSFEQWIEVCEDMGLSMALLPWHVRRANLCIRGFCFQKEDLGKRLVFQDGVILEIMQETQPCERMEALHAGLRDVLSVDMRGGVSCRVIVGGTIALNDTVSFMRS